MNINNKLFLVIILSIMMLCVLCCKIKDAPHPLTDGEENDNGVFSGYSFADTLTEHSGTEIESYSSDKAFNGVYGEGDTAGSLDVFVVGEGEYAVFEWEGKNIINGNGNDFKVFENGFYISGNGERMSLDLGTVQVSRDGIEWMSFPVHYTNLPYENSPIGKFGFVGLEPVFINFDDEKLIHPALNSAGGDAFDLSDAGIEKGDYIKYIKIIDGSETHPDGQLVSNGIDIDGICAFYWSNQ